jgi:putative transposase
MIYKFMAEHTQEFAVVRMCKVLEVSASGYHAWRRRAVSPRAQANQGLLEQIRDVHAESRGTYGSPRVHARLRQRGVACGRHRVARLMRLGGIVAVPPHRRRPARTQGHAETAARPNLLAQDFRAQRPNQKWVADITYIETREGWLYLAAVLDLFSRRVVGWSMADRREATLVAEALQMAVGRRRPGSGLLHHSDQGAEYMSHAYQGHLARIRARVSMSGVGSCYDNAVIESFFGTLKGECARRRFASREEARRHIFEFIELWYNRQRLHSSLGYLSPAEFEHRLSSPMMSVH